MNTWSCYASTLSLTSSFRRLSDRRFLLGLAVVLMMAVPPAWAQTYDYGDAPDAVAPGDPRYPTLVAHSGARHTIDATAPHLGLTAPDAEVDGQPNADATGDVGDEDGITFTTNLILGEQATLEVIVTLGTTPSIDTAYLDGWIDFNADDSWTGTNEHIIAATALTDGTHSINFTVPSSAAVGETFARFRLSTSATGLASFNDDGGDGEVEDYRVTIIASDWGDAPNSYDTLRVNDGPRHGITGPYLGAAAPDAEVDGQLDGAGEPPADEDKADGDDEDVDGDDEDGVTFPTLIRGQTAALTVEVGGEAAFVDAWIDFDNSGTFEAGEKVATHEAVTVGTHQLTSFTVPNGAAVGNTYSRVRISTSSTTLAHTGLADDGEVEDHQVTILGLDFGDADDPSYPTLLASNGARHPDTDAQPFLGTVGPDVDADGQPAAAADGDDNDGTDDEDGIVFTSDLVPGQTADIEVTAAGGGKLDAWIDFNGNGIWETGDQIFTSRDLVDGPNALTFSVPAGASPGITTAARFRYSTAGGLSPTGTAVDGEVEDLMVDIAPVADLGITKTIDVATAIPGRTRVTFTITATNATGPNDAVGASVTDAFGDDLVGVIWTCSSSGSAVCHQAGGAGDIQTTVDLPVGDSVTFTARAWVVADALGVTCSSDRCLSNSADVDVDSGSSGTYDLNSANDTATVETTVLQPEADLSIDKDDGLTRGSPGDLGSYAIRVTNPGPSTATAVTVTDNFPTAKIERDTNQCGAGTDTDLCWDCSPAPTLDELEVQIEGQNSVSGLEGASSSAVSPDGAHVYATGSIDDALVVFSRDAVTGLLTFVEAEKDGVDDTGDPGATVDGLDGAAAVAISPDGDHVYVAGMDDNAIVVFDRDGMTGELSFVQVLIDGNSPVDGIAGAHDVAVSPDGAQVYVAGPTDNSIAVFNRNPITGALTFVEFHQDGSGSTDGLAGAHGLTVTPDGTSLYAAGPDDNAVAAFERDSDPASANFGKLTYIDFYVDSPSSDGLEGAASVTVSPDGQHVYAAGSIDDAVVVFSRNSGTGALTYVDFIKDGDPGGVNGLDGATKVTVSPDGSLVFVAAPLNSSVAAFSRNSNPLDSNFGKLTFADWFTAPDYGESGAAATVDGLGETNSVSLSPDGLHLFSTGKTVGKNATLVAMKVSAGGVCPSPLPGDGDLSHQIYVPACSWVEFTAYYRIRDAASGTIHNEASLTITDPTDLVDGDTGNDTDFDDTGVGLEVDIDVTKTGGVATPIPGQELDYTITVTNHGPQSVDGTFGHIVVSDLFPIYNG